MKRNWNKRRILAGVFFISGMILYGCSVLSPQPDQSRYFLLTPIASPADSVRKGNASDSAMTVGLGPISLPHYLDRPEVVTRLTDTEFAISETDRWGEPLDMSVSRVLSQDLLNELPGLQVVPFPWSKKTQVDYGISVVFLRLEKTAGGKADVQAMWTIRRSHDNQLVRSGVTNADLPTGSDQRSASEALSQGVSQVSQAIAKVIQKQSELRAESSMNTGS